MVKPIYFVLWAYVIGEFLAIYVQFYAQSNEAQARSHKHCKSTVLKRNKKAMIIQNKWKH